MDYKYIEQLLERYWQCTATDEEEQILRLFFRQDSVPEHLARYKALFAYAESQRGLHTDSGFESRVLGMLERPAVKARRLHARSRFAPLLKAAAMVALVFAVGGVVNETMTADKSSVVYVYDQFGTGDTTDPQVAEADTAKAPLAVQVPCKSELLK